MKVELTRQGGVLGIDKQIRIEDGVLEVTEDGSVLHTGQVSAARSAALQEKIAQLPEPPSGTSDEPAVSDALDTYLKVESEPGHERQYPVTPGEASAIAEIVDLIDAAETEEPAGP
jgi:hypothetical protein